MRNVSEIIDYAAERVKEHQTSLDPSRPRDFIDHMLLEMQKVLGVSGEAVLSP